MPNDFEDLVSLLTELLTNRFTPKSNFIRGVLGDGLGNVIVAGKTDRNYVRFNRNSAEYFEIFNKTVNPVHDWPVLIGQLPWQPGLTQVVDTDWSAYEQSGWGGTVGQTAAHAPTHEQPNRFPGSDPINVYMRAIVPLKTIVLGTGSTSVFVNSYEYASPGCSGSVWGGTPGIDFQSVMSAQATGTARYMGIYLDPSTNSLGVVTGTSGVFSDAIDPPYVDFPPGVIPSARVKIYGGQIAVNESDVWDARRPFAHCATGTASGGGAPSGPAGGDLDGTYPNPEVDGLRGNAVADEAPSEGQLLMWTGSAWRPRSVAAAGGGGTPSGPASGDLTGSYPSPSVAGLFGYSLVDDAPTEGYVLTFTGSAWRPSPAGIDTGIGIPTGPAGGDLFGSFPDPQVDGLRGYSIFNEAPTEGYILTYTGSAWRPRPATVNTEISTPTGPAGGDLTGTYPNPSVVNLYTRPIFNEAPSEGQVLMWTGSAWRPRAIAVGGGGGGAPSGPAGGDLTGSYPNPTVTGLYGYAVANEAPSLGETLIFTGSAWRPRPAASGGGGGAGVEVHVTGKKLASAGTFDFSSLSSDYEYLILKCWLRTDKSGSGTWGASEYDTAKIYFNNDTGNNYTGGFGGTVASGSSIGSGGTVNAATARGYGLLGRIDGDGARANCFSYLEIVIPGYADTSYEKHASFESRQAGNRSTSNDYSWVLGTVDWRSTSAINRIEIDPFDGTNFVIGSRVDIYGKTVPNRV